MRDLYIATVQTRNYFYVVGSMSLASFYSIQRPPEQLYRISRYVTVVQGHSRSSKLSAVEVRMDFLLVFHCNQVPIFYRFWDLAIYLSNIYDFCQFYSPQSSLKPSSGVFHFVYERWCQETKSPWSPRWWKRHYPMNICLHGLCPKDGQTRRPYI